MLKKRIKRVRTKSSIKAIEKDLVRYARAFLKSQGESIDCLNKIKSFSKSDRVDNIIANSLRFILGDDEKTFGQESLRDRLKRDGLLRVTCLLYMYTCKIVGRAYLSNAEFSMFRSLLGVSLGSDSHHVTNDARILIKMGAPSSMLPQEYMVMLMQLDEFEKAISFIIKKCDSLREVGTFLSFDEAKEYYSIEAGKLIGELNAQGMYGTHNIELFALMLIGQKIGVNINYPMYLVGDMVKDIKDQQISDSLKETLEDAIKKSIRVIQAINGDDGDE